MPTQQQRRREAAAATPTTTTTMQRVVAGAAAGFGARHLRTPSRSEPMCSCDAGRVTAKGGPGAKAKREKELGLG